MQPIEVIATLSFVLAGSAVGIRLLSLWYRTQDIPARHMGLGMLLVCGVSYPLMMLVQTDALSEAQHRAVFALSEVAMAAGCISIAAFARLVFRPDSTWAWGLFIAIAGWWTLLVLLSCSIAVSGDIASFYRIGVRFHGSQLGMFLAFGWNAVEAFLYRKKLLKQQRVGLVSSVVVNRIALWSLAGACSAIINVIVSIAALDGSNPVDNTAVRLVIGLFGFTSAVALTLAFFPTAGYKRWITRRAGMES